MHGGNMRRKQPLKRDTVPLTNLWHAQHHDGEIDSDFMGVLVREEATFLLGRISNKHKKICSEKVDSDRILSVCVV